jgi:hypothetical protein
MKITITKDKQGGRFGINLRYPQKFEFEEAIQRFTKEIKAYGLTFVVTSPMTSVWNFIPIFSPKCDS